MANHAHDLLEQCAKLHPDSQSIVALNHLVELLNRVAGLDKTRWRPEALPLAVSIVNPSVTRRSVLEPPILRRKLRLYFSIFICMDVSFPHWIPAINCQRIF